MLRKIIWILCLGASLNGCSYFQSTQSNEHYAICNELKQRIIFNGATSYELKADEQRAQLDRLNEAYNAQGC